MLPLDFALVFPDVVAEVRVLLCEGVLLLPIKGVVKAGIFKSPFVEANGASFAVEEGGVGGRPVNDWREDSVVHESRGFLNMNLLLKESDS